jgi:general secretion pathway protein M
MSRTQAGAKKLSAWGAALGAHWRALAPRERLALGGAAWVVGAVAVWLLGLQQPLTQGRLAQQRLAGLQEQQGVMQRQATEAQALKTAAPLAAAQAEQALQAATVRLGPRGRLLRQGDRAVLTVEGASGSELQAWWAEARAGARARIVELQLSRTERGLAGTITVTLGATP